MKPKNISFVVEKIEEELCLEIITAGQKALAAYDQDPDYFGNYTLGCSFWENLSGRLYKVCQKSSFFTATDNQNVLTIHATVDGESISFYAHRVDSASRIPCASKYVKSLAMENSNFLSDEIEQLIAKPDIYYIGCDLDIIKGLGVVTFNQLFAIDKNKFQAKTLATLGRKTLQAPAKPMQVEQLKKPTVHRKIVQQDQNILKKEQ